MKDDLRLEWQLFLLALQFLTRIPVPGPVPYSDDLMVRSAKYYPAVGAFVGLLSGSVLWLGSWIWPSELAVLLAMAVGVLVTGALHEDGLADMADGLGAAHDRDKALSIMRDPRLGSYGGITLMGVLALKAAALMALSPSHAALALVLGHGVGRMASVHVIATTTYARSDAAKFPAPQVTSDGYRVALATALGLLILGIMGFGLWASVLGFIGCVALAQAMRAIFVRRLGGHTGDCLGATQQMGELGLYLGLAAWL